MMQFHRRNPEHSDLSQITAEFERFTAVAQMLDLKGATR
jgi:hypothetical protein